MDAAGLLALATSQRDGTFLSHSWRVFMVSGKELVAKESVTNYPEVIPSPLTLVLSKKEKEKKRSIISTLLEHQLCVRPCGRHRRRCPTG